MNSKRAARPRFAVRSFMMNSNRLLPGFYRLNLTLRGRLTLQGQLLVSSVVPAFHGRKSCGFAKLKVPKAPELHTKAKGPSRAVTHEERAGFSHSVKEHTYEVSGRVGSRHSWRLDRYLVSDEPPLDYALSQNEGAYEPAKTRSLHSLCGRLGDWR